jgi:BirA family biotin operon repressor/biotin-[acetyl-CoA-carboxylase] ligase
MSILSVLESDRNRGVLSSTRIVSCLNIALLDRLRAVAGNHVPWAALGSDFERARIELEALRSFGFEIEIHPHRGAAYRGPAARLCPDQIEHSLETRRIGRRIAVWNRVTSTNDLAARAGTSRSNDGLVVLAEEQTAGRGRRGRSWTAPACSSILMSVVVFPPRSADDLWAETGFSRAWLTALGAVATAETVTAWSGRDATIKWPNDVRIDGRKIAGVLVERALAPGPRGVTGVSSPNVDAGWGAVIGIGLNVNLKCDDFPGELTAGATSLQIEGGGARFDRSEIARDLIRRLDHWYDASLTVGYEVLSVPWQARSEHLGRIVRITTGSGSACGRLVAIDLRLGLDLSHASNGGREARFGTTPGLTRFPNEQILRLEEELSERCDQEQPCD